MQEILKKKTEDSTEKELSLDELREKLARKELEEKLKEKHVDTSLIGVCQTCHIPIYHGEPVYTPNDYKTEGSHSGEYGEASHGPGFTKPDTTYTGGGYQGRDKRHSVSEGWIQCGWCYKQYQKELESVKAWERRWLTWGLLGIPFGAIGFGLGYSKILDLYGWMGRPDAPPLHSANE
ncbi:MAG: hypothetical protein I3273_00325 [Candidatus Moeniiplasma glomeromycotorum]|nr:hypothetical protein [Candidatus Moeniiplasma glomeromycotorum]MCE8168561.1 hypothetical protein [Candidatus Moeniiplasma glomeromycotorum]